MELILNRTGVTLADALADAGYPPELPCGGTGKCGNCRVRAFGALSEPVGRERGLEKGVRLACQAICLGEVHVLLDERTEKNSAEPNGNISSDHSKKFAAVDIGTTTLEAALYNEKGIRLASASEMNPGRRFGADVITRIGASAEHLDELVGELRGAIAHLLRELTDGEIESVAVAGNTVMLHFFAGLDPSGMAAYPFTPTSLFGRAYAGDELLPGCGIGEIYLPPCVSAFIGADTVCALLAADLKPDESCFLVDIGTNGEMALWQNQSLRCASTAAGPALEGAEISCGMQAKAGAIDHVSYENGRLVCSVIGDAEPVGLCGSGLISAAAALLDASILDESGFLEAPAKLGGNVILTQEDIRKLQLAKSAIRAGIDTLYGGEVDRFCIAGNLGSHLDLESCRRIGLLPYRSEGYEILGNAALDGAAKLLFDPNARSRCEELVSCAKVISLEDDAGFCERFVERMLF